MVVQLGIVIDLEIDLEHLVASCDRFDMHIIETYVRYMFVL